MDNWIRNNCFDRLPELTGEDVDSFFIESKKGFILLDFGQFDLLRTKTYITEICQKHAITCGKVSVTNFALNTVIQLMRAEN
jgi:hypothetical protein